MPNTDQTIHFVNQGIRSLGHVYRSKTEDGLHRMHWNESPFDFPADLKKDVLSRLARSEWSRYAGSVRPFTLIDRLADYVGVTPDMVVVSNGSSDLIRLVLSSVLQPGDHVTMPVPSFMLYRRGVEMLNAVLHEVPTSSDNNFALPVNELIDSVRINQSKVVLLCAPNNPTGTIYSLEGLRQIVEECDALVVIDEAYAEFCGQDLSSLLSEFGNIVLLRTFSKAYAMAGVRIGYALASPGISAEMQKAVSSFPINLFTEIAALVALDHYDRFLTAIQHIVDERERLSQEFKKLPGLQVFPSGTNFLLVRPNIPASLVYECLLQEYKVLICDLTDYPELPNYLRISIGMRWQNDLVINAIHACLSGALGTKLVMQQRQNTIRRSADNPNAGDGLEL